MEVEKMDKVAITCEEPSLDAKVDPRFGRAAGFLVVDLNTMDFEYLDNGASQTMAQGAGIQAAESVARSGVRVVLTGFVGPKAFQALSAAGIKVGLNLEGTTVKEAIERYKVGNVEIAMQPNKGTRERNIP
jgi:predicted Fe-Mo cluster-binding NifX family protein